jgi:surface protein
MSSAMRSGKALAVLLLFPLLAVCTATPASHASVSGFAEDSNAYPAGSTPARRMNTGHSFRGDADFAPAIALWFSDNAAALEAYGEISTWDTQHVTSMRNLFRVFDPDSLYQSRRPGWVDSPELVSTEISTRIQNFNEDISSWDVSSVTNMDLMFAVPHDYGNSTFNQDISSWDISSVTSMRMMFNGASTFDQELCWDIGGVEDTYWMFGCPHSYPGYAGPLGSLAPPGCAGTGAPTDAPTAAPTKAPTAVPTMIGNSPAIIALEAGEVAGIIVCTVLVIWLLVRHCMYGIPTNQASPASSTASI